MTFRLFPLEGTRLKPSATVADAISDLPKLKMGEGGEIVCYDCDPRSEYARLLRNGNRET